MLTPIAVALSGVILAVGFGTYIIYKKGYAAGLAGKDAYAAQKIAEYRAEQQWVYEDGLAPRTRTNKITGETQRRYLKPSSLAQQMLGGPSYSEWRTITAEVDEPQKATKRVKKVA